MVAQVPNTIFTTQAAPLLQTHVSLSPSVSPCLRVETLPLTPVFQFLPRAARIPDGGNHVRRPLHRHPRQRRSLPRPPPSGERLLPLPRPPPRPGPASVT